MNPNFLNQSPREQMMELMGLQPHIMGAESHYGGGGGGGGSSGGGNKKTKPKPKPKPKLTGPGMGPQGKLSSPQSQANRSRFQSRESQGLSGLTGGPKGDKSKGTTTISNYRASQTKQVQDAAKARNEKASSTSAISNTSTQVAADNAKYGNTFPSGAIGISEEGKAEAAANLAARTAPEGGFTISDAGRKQAAIQLGEKRAADKELARIQSKDPGMAAFISSQPANIRNNMLIGGQTRAAGVELGVGLGTVIGGKALVGGLGIGAASKGLGYKGAQVGFTGMGKTGFDAIKGGAKYIPSSKPQILGQGAYSAPTVQGAARYAGKGTSLGGTQTPGGIVQSIVPGKASRIGMIESQAKVPGATFDKGVSLAKRVSEGAFPKSSLANTFRNQMNLGVAPGGGFGTNLGPVTAGAAITAGGLNIASAKDDSKQSNTGRTLSNRALGAVDAVFGTDLDNLGGRTTPFGESLTSSINAFNTANQNIGELTGSTNPVKNLAGSLMLGKNVSMEDLAATTTAAKTFKDEGLTEGLKSLTPKTTESIGDVYNALEAGRLTNPLTGNDVYKQAMSDFGGESFQSKINEGVNYFTEKYGQLTENEKGNRKVVSEMLTAKDPRLDSLKALGYQMKENPKLGIQEQVKNALKPNAPQLPGVNKNDLGIMGSLGNFILSNQGKSIVTGNLPGTNNALDLASNIVKTGSDPTSDTYKKSQAFLRTIDKGTPTPGSIIKGVIPRLGGTRSSGTPVGQLRSGASLPSLTAALQQQQQQQPIEELPLPTNADLPNLQDIQQRAYNRQMRIYGAPSFMAQFRPTQRVRPLRRRQYFNRDYFTQFA